MMGLVWAQPVESFKSSAERFVMLALADCYNDDSGMCCPSARYLAAKVGLADERSVRRHIDSLAEQGWLTKERRARRGDGTLGVWQFSLDAVRLHRASTPAGEQGRTNHRASTPAGNRAWTPAQEPEGEPEGEPEVEPEPTRANDNDVVSAEIDPFVEFWSRYPRKVGKTGRGGASGAYARALRSASPDQIAAGLDAWLAYWEARNEPGFIPHASTWLNQSRWEDKPPPLPSSLRGTVAANLAAVDDVMAAYANGGIAPGSMLGLQAVR